ncbi:MAG: efflux RND transporter periplasmic adaptor subunit [Isosphaeraceae bacterium]
MTNPAPRTAARDVPAKRPGRSRKWLFLALLVLIAGIGGGYWYLHQGGKPAKDAKLAASGTDTSGQTRVEVTRPKAGGIARTVDQIASIHAFEFAELHAEVSGFLKSQKVDIGDQVKEGDVLAVIAAPELEKAVEVASAALELAKAQVNQAEAKILTAQAQQQAAAADVSQAEADVERFVASRKYREKERIRIRQLARSNAVEQKLVDEQEDQYEAAVAAEHSAEATVRTNKAKLVAAGAMVESAKADLAEAKANVDVAAAALAKAQVYVDYTRIVSPYTGVVTLRSFHRGDFIPLSSEGNSTPLLAVARTDPMRVVIMVPDRDVPFTDVGDPAEIHVDALPGEVFHGKVSRFASTEDPADRTMRTEVDLPNPDNRLRDGMYGGATIILEPPSPKAFTVPASCLFDPENGEGVVYVVRDGKLHKTDVTYGKDNGVKIEILSGVSADDDVVARYNGAVADGAPVQSVPFKEIVRVDKAKE